MRKFCIKAICFLSIVLSSNLNVKAQQIIFSTNNFNDMFLITQDSSDKNICIAHLSDSMNIYSILAWQTDSLNNCSPIGKFLADLISETLTIDSISQLAYSLDTVWSIEKTYSIYYCHNTLQNISEKYLLYTLNSGNFSFTMMGKSHDVKFIDMNYIFSAFIVKYEEEFIN